MRETILKPLGVITQPNQQGQYPAGAMAVANNVHLRDPGIVSSVPIPEAYGSAFGTNAYVPRRLLAGDAKILALAESSGTAQLSWISSSANSNVTFAELSSVTVSAGKTQLARFRERFYACTGSGVLTIDSEGAATGQLAGMPTPRVIIPTAVNPGGGLADGYCTAVCALFVRPDATYRKPGAPSIITELVNTSAGGTSRRFTLRVYWAATTSAHLRAGDLLELYRTPSELGDEPGAHFLLSKRYTLTATDLLNSYVDFSENCQDSALSEELYTNDGQQGEFAGKYPPALATDMANYKGHTFYVQPTEAPTLKVGNTTTWGVHSVLAGYGEKHCTGDTTSGSAVLANVTPGVHVEMRCTGSGVPVNTYVVSLSPVTLSNNCTATATGVALTFTDRLEISGTIVDCPTPGGMLQNLGSATSTHATFSRNLRFNITPGPVLAEASYEDLNVTFWPSWAYYGAPTIRGSAPTSWDPWINGLTGSVTTGTSQTRSNCLRISAADQPEAVPIGEGSELFIGSGTVYRVIAAQDALWCLASDGLHRISGEYPSWRVDPVDPSLVLSRRNAVDVLRGVVYAHTGRGFVAIADGQGVVELSEGIIGNLLVSKAYADDWAWFVSADDATQEVWVTQYDGETQRSYVWHPPTKSFCTRTYWAHTAMTHAPYLRGQVAGFPEIAKPTLEVAGTSTTTAASGASVLYQPVNGTDAFSLTQWIDCTYHLTYATGASFTIVPYLNAPFPSTQHASVTASQLLAVDRTRSVTVACPIELSFFSEWYPVALAASILPGLTPGPGETSMWTLNGISLRWLPASEESDDTDD